MPEFLKLIPPGEALKCWFDYIPAQPTIPERIKTTDALGRVLAEDIIAPHPLPTFPRSTVDGYAVISKDTFGASDSLPIYLNITGEVPMGFKPENQVVTGTAILIHTGGMLPEGADSVVMLEHTQSSRPGEIEVTRPVAPLENIIQIGEDVKTGEVVIPSGTKIRSAEIGGLLAFGIQSIMVSRRARIGIISTGDEVISPSVEPSMGQVRDINSYSLQALIHEHGGEAIQYGIVPDEPARLQEVLFSALRECDSVLITAGSSASARDMTSQVINEAGKPGVVVHGINIRPGKPAILAVCDGKPVIGLPGNPVSALVIARLFVPAMIGKLHNQTSLSLRSQITARLTLNISSQAGREDYIPVKISKINGELFAEPIFFKSNLIFNLVKADGLMIIPADANGLNAGDTVQVMFI